jgi:hypothetical protein
MIQIIKSHTLCRELPICGFHERHFISHSLEQREHDNKIQRRENTTGHFLQSRQKHFEPLVSFGICKL